MERLLIATPIRNLCRRAARAFSCCWLYFIWRTRPLVRRPQGRFSLLVCCVLVCALVCHTEITTLGGHTAEARGRPRDRPGGGGGEEGAGAERALPHRQTGEMPPTFGRRTWPMYGTRSIEVPSSRAGRKCLVATQTF